jgi:hypothetical protein
MSSRAWMDARIFGGFPRHSLAVWLRSHRRLGPPVEGSPDAAAIRDVGLRNEYLDYRADTNIGRGSKRRLHGVADRAALGWPVIPGQRR